MVKKAVFTLLLLSALCYADRLCLYDCCQLGPDCSVPSALTPDGFCNPNEDEPCPVPSGGYGINCCYAAQSMYVAESLVLPHDMCVGYLSGALYNQTTPRNPVDECGYYDPSGFNYFDRAKGWLFVLNNSTAVHDARAPPFAPYVSKFGGNYTIPSPNANNQTCMLFGCGYPECCFAKGVPPPSGDPYCAPDINACPKNVHN